MHTSHLFSFTAYYACFTVTYFPKLSRRRQRYCSIILYHTLSYPLFIHYRIWATHTSDSVSSRRKYFRQLRWRSVAYHSFSDSSREIQSARKSLLPRTSRGGAPAGREDLYLSRVGSGRVTLTRPAPLASDPVGVRPCL